MNKNLKISIFAFLVIAIPFSSILGQEKKNEQKIKIITDDGSGAKVIIDTVMYGDKGPDSLSLKDGSVMYLNHSKGDGNHYFVISDEKDKKGITKEMTVIRTDTFDLKDDERRNVMYYRNDRDGNHRYKVITHSSGDGADKSEMVIVNKDQHGEGDNDIFTWTESDDSDVEKSRFVIAKDGMVVTIEGTDEAKTKALADEIGQKLGVNGKEEKKEITKVKTQKKTIR